MKKENRFTGWQITTMVVAVCIAALLLPVGAMAVSGTLVNLVDPDDPREIAHVQAGALRVAPRATSTLLRKGATLGGSSNPPIVLGTVSVDASKQIRVYGRLSCTGCRLSVKLVIEEASAQPIAIDSGIVFDNSSNFTTTTSIAAVSVSRLYETPGTILRLTLTDIKFLTPPPDNYGFFNLAVFG